MTEVGAEGGQDKRRPGRAPAWAAEILHAIGEARLREVRDALLADAVGLDDRDAVLLHRAAGALLRELVPEGGPAEAVTAYGALLHMLLLAWHTGWVTKEVTAPELSELATSTPSALRTPVSDDPPAPRFHAAPSVIWTALPDRRVWSQPFAGAAHEPLNGFFVLQRTGQLRVLAILGQHPARDGFTTLEAEARLPLEMPGRRPDGAAPFTSLMPGGDRAGLLSLATPHEVAAFAAALVAPAAAG